MRDKKKKRATKKTIKQFYEDVEDVSGASMESLDEIEEPEDIIKNTLKKEQEMKMKRSIYFVEIAVNESFIEFLKDKELTTIECFTRVFNITRLLLNGQFKKLVEEELSRKIKRSEAHKKKDKDALNKPVAP